MAGHVMSHVEEQGATELVLARRAVPGALEAWAGALGEERGAIEARLVAMREELGARSVIEALLVERILVCWLALEVAERALVERTGREHSRASGTYWDRRVSGAQRRYVEAVKALAQVRKLGV